MFFSQLVNDLQEKHIVKLIMLLSSKLLLFELSQISICKFSDIVLIFSSFNNVFHCSMFHLWWDSMSWCTLGTRDHIKYQNMNESHLWLRSSNQFDLGSWNCIKAFIANVKIGSWSDLPKIDQKNDLTSFLLVENLLSRNWSSRIPKLILDERSIARWWSSSTWNSPMPYWPYDMAPMISYDK